MTRRLQRRAGARLGLTLLVTALVLAVAVPATQAACTAARPKPVTQLTAVWFQYVCPSCHESLPVAQSPQAESERQFIQLLIHQCDTPAEIKTVMVKNYGIVVLAQPPAKGFNWALYVLPPVLLVSGIAFLLVTLPKWRARARARSSVPFRGGGEGSGALSAEDAKRLDEDLAGFN